MRLKFTELQMSVPICLMVMARFQRLFFCFTCCGLNSSAVMTLLTVSCPYLPNDWLTFIWTTRPIKLPLLETAVDPDPQGAGLMTNRCLPFFWLGVSPRSCPAITGGILSGQKYWGGMGQKGRSQSWSVVLF